MTKENQEMSAAEATPFDEPQTSPPPLTINLKSLNSALSDEDLAEYLNGASELYPNTSYPLYHAFLARYPFDCKGELIRRNSEFSCNVEINEDVRKLVTWEFVTKRPTTLVFSVIFYPDRSSRERDNESEADLEILEFPPNFNESNNPYYVRRPITIYTAHSRPVRGSYITHGLGKLIFSWHTVDNAQRAPSAINRFRRVGATGSVQSAYDATSFDSSQVPFRSVSQPTTPLQASYPTTPTFASTTDAKLMSEVPSASAHLLYRVVVFANPVVDSEEVEEESTRGPRSGSLSELDKAHKEAKETAIRMAEEERVRRLQEQEKWRLQEELVRQANRKHVIMLAERERLERLVYQRRLSGTANPNGPTSSSEQHRNLMTDIARRRVLDVVKQAVGERRASLELAEERARLMRDGLVRKSMEELLLEEKEAEEIEDK